MTTLPPDANRPPTGFPPNSGQPQPVFNPAQPQPAKGYPQPGFNPYPPRVIKPTKVEPVIGAKYHQVWRTPFYEMWRPIVLFVVALIGFFVFSTILTMIAVLFDAINRHYANRGEGHFDMKDLMTPAVFTANNIGLALLIVFALLLPKLFFKQRAGWISSVAGRLRFGWLGICAAIALLLWAILYAVTMFAMDGWSDVSGKLHTSSQTVPLLISIILTTPFQAAGEEYGFRGLANRCGASLFSNPKVGLVVGAIFSSLLFMVAHGAGDIWLNIFYFTFGLIACFLVWRTGGLEASIALHVINNLFGLALVPWSDLSEVFDRQAGVGDPSMLIPLVFILLYAAIVSLLAKKKDLANEVKSEAVQFDVNELAAQLNAAQAYPMPVMMGQPQPGMPMMGQPMPRPAMPGQMQMMPPAQAAMPPAQAPMPPAQQLPSQQPPAPPAQGSNS